MAKRQKAASKARKGLDLEAFLTAGAEGTSSLVDDSPWDGKSDDSTYPPSRVPSILGNDVELYVEKAQDYSTPDDPYWNLKLAANIAEQFCHDMPSTHPARAAATLIGVKIARLCVLGVSGEGNFESTMDTLRDLRVYAAMLEDLVKP